MENDIVLVWNEDKNTIHQEFQEYAKISIIVWKRFYTYETNYNSLTKILYQKYRLINLPKTLMKVEKTNKGYKVKEDQLTNNVELNYEVLLELHNDATKHTAP